MKKIIDYLFECDIQFIYTPSQKSEPKNIRIGNLEDWQMGQINKISESEKLSLTLKGALIIKEKA